MKCKSTISDVTRAYVLLLGKEKKYSCRVIAKKAKISKSSVSLILRENGKRKDYLKRDNKIGRPHKLTERDRRKLIRTIQTLRQEDPNFTVKQLLAESGLISRPVSYRTIYREVKSAGFNFLPARKKGVLTSRDRKKRKAFAKQCKKILSAKPNFFSRDIAFYLDGVSFVHKTQPLTDALAPKGRVWRKRRESLQVTAKGSKNLAGGKRLHLLVAISHNNGVVLVEEYEKMTGTNFARFVRNQFPVLFSRKRGRKWFVMDNDPSQRSLAARKAIKKECCELFCIPPRSPHLNPIENMFHLVKKQLECQVRDRHIIRETWQEFKSRVKKTLYNVPVDYVNNIITSMPRRIHAVVKADGFRTKY